MISSPLFDTAPNFSQPIAVLKHCHGRIRKQIATLQKLITHLPISGPDSQAQQAARAVLRYFDVAAPHHHADEEEDLLPVLQSLAKGDDALTLQGIIPEILREHLQLNSQWQQLSPQLRDIASGLVTRLDPEIVNAFSEMYLAHMEKEENVIAPLALRLFSAAQMAKLGEAMQARRGIVE